MGAHGSLGYAQAAGDLGVGVAGGDQVQQFPVPGGEPGGWVAAALGVEVGLVQPTLEGPKPNVRRPRGRWLDAALAVALIAAAVMVVMTGRASRPATARADRPSTAAAPALLPSTVRTRIPLPFGEPAT